MNPIFLIPIQVVAAFIIAAPLSCTTASAAEDELAQALREDKKLCSTPEGLMYEVKFLAAIAPEIGAALNSCCASTKTYNFDMAFVISSEGKIKRTVCTRNQPVATCAASKLQGASGPLPPRGSCTIFVHYSSKPK
jgi:hypothetical protein